MAGDCGTCTMCCKLMAVTELKKPKNVLCSHCDIGQGCKIYDERPTARDDMTDIEKRILENQMEILWALRHLAEKASPELVGRAGALDRMRDDLADAAKRTQALFVSSQVSRPQLGGK